MSQLAEKSKFVTVVAWIFIVVAGFATFISILQNIMINLMFPIEKMTEALNEAEAQEHIPFLFRFLFSNIRIFFFGFLVISATTFVSAIGLLKRKNWARIIFIIILSLGILWNISGLFMQHLMFSSMPELPNQEGVNQFKVMMNIMRVFTLIMAIGISILFGWIIKKFTSQRIKAEFVTTIENKNI